jgi:hypothetical protein
MLSSVEGVTLSQVTVVYSGSELLANYALVAM